LGRADPGAPSHGRTVAKKDHSARAVRLFRKQAPKQRRRSSLRPPASAVAMTIDQSRITKSCAEHLGSCAAARTTSPLHGTGGSPERRHVQSDRAGRWVARYICRVSCSRATRMPLEAPQWPLPVASAPWSTAQAGVQAVRSCVTRPLPTTPRRLAQH
jgi:hypothetical protein